MDINTYKMFVIENTPNISKSTKEKIRYDLQKQLNVFLANGNKITHIGPGVSGITKTGY